METKKKIKMLIGNGKLGEALDELMALDISDDFIMLKGRFVSNKRDFLQSLMTRDRHDMENARIGAAILDLLDELDFEPQPKEGEKEGKPSSFQNNFTDERTKETKAIFLSYAEADLKDAQALMKHLVSLKRSGKANFWYNANLQAGTDRQEEVQSRLAQSDIILLLISAEFISSEKIWQTEIRPAMDRHKKGEAVVVPILIRPCAWESLPFGAIQSLPPGAKPVSSWANRDQAWTLVAKEISRLV